MSDDLSIPNSGFRGSRAGRYGTGPNRARSGMDPDTRRLLMFAGGLGGVLVVLIGASALVGRHSGEVPVVTADPRPIREKPANPGGMKIDGAENDVFSGGSDTSNAKLAAAPENPDTKALRTAETAPPPAAKIPTPAPAPVAPAQVAKPPVVANAPPAVQSAPSAPKPAPIDKPAVVASAPAAPKPAPAASGHQPMVQLAALTSEDAARAEWTRLAKKMPALLSGRQPNVSRTERDGHTFWRLRTSGFADVAQARAFCDKVRADGGGCSVADF